MFEDFSLKIIVIFIYLSVLLNIKPYTKIFICNMISCNAIDTFCCYFVETRVCHAVQTRLTFKTPSFSLPKAEFTGKSHHTNFLSVSYIFLKKGQKLYTFTNLPFVMCYFHTCITYGMAKIS